MRRSAIQGDQSSERKRNVATGLMSPRLSRSIAKVTRRIGHRTPQFPHIQSYDMALHIGKALGAKMDTSSH